MRPTHFLQTLSVGLLLCLAHAFASAADVAKDAAKDLAVPPKLEQLEGAGEPASTIKQEPQNKITETRSQGKVTDIKVKSGKSTYHIKPNTPAGSALPGDMQGNSVRGAQWEIMEFDVGQKKQKSSKKAEPVTPAAPPPAP